MNINRRAFVRNRKRRWLDTLLIGERERITDARGQQRVARAVRQVLSTTSMSVAAAMIVSPALVFAQSADQIAGQSTDQTATQSTAQTAAQSTAQTAGQTLTETVVTGTRIIREGYEAPTPLTVISAGELKSAADTNEVETLATLPEMSGVATASGNSINEGASVQGLQTLNLRSLGSNRVLVLLDGQRVSPSSYINAVDITTFPSQLVQRVDIVTGGASAVYGSDAVAGVVNFVLDKTFTGVKGEVSGGVTNYGDDRNYKIDLTAGEGFADNRGHILISGEQLHNGGISGDGGRSWDRHGWAQLTNPNYTATNGQPAQLLLSQCSYSTATAGGIIATGPLKGTAFGSGGSPYQFQYGSIVSGPVMCGGGGWATNDVHPLNSLDPIQTNTNLFTRVSYDVTDKVNAFVQYNYGQSVNSMPLSIVLGLPAAAAYQIQSGNPYLPASVQNAMTADGLSSVEIGSWNADMGDIFDYNTRLEQHLNFGLEGKFDFLGSSWNWNAYYSYGGTNIGLHSDVGIISRFEEAISAVRNPANGQIVCASVLAGSKDGCQPWDALGIGVNAGNQAAFQWIYGGQDFEYALIKETDASATLTGEPFSDWAGPVSIALNGEHRNDADSARTDPYSFPSSRDVGNYTPTNGTNAVTEGALETVIPLAKGQSWAQDWDLNAAGRGTDYKYSGYVTTYKFGMTYSPIEDIRFRVNRSRDIRAPNIQELFSPPQGSPSGGLSTLNRYLNNAPIAVGGFSYKEGNAKLLPEKANTWEYGVVLQPRFIPGFSMSVDYYDVKINGAIAALSAQQVIDSCYYGYYPSECSAFSVAALKAGQPINIYTYPINVAEQDARGIDLEAGYHLPLASIVESWRGDLTLHVLDTWYIRDYSISVFSVADNIAGQNEDASTPDSATAPPRWKLNVTATYQLDPIVVSLTGRAFSHGTINNNYLQCTSGCPVSTAALTTINNNSLPGEFYLDANISYKFDIGKAHSELFFSARNLLNRSPPPELQFQIYYNQAVNDVLYDTFGAVYRAGIRVQM